jgi:hypothetical protein
MRMNNGEQSLLHAVRGLNHLWHGSAITFRAQLLGARRKADGICPLNTSQKGKGAGDFIF